MPGKFFLDDDGYRLVASDGLSLIRNMEGTCEECGCGGDPEPPPPSGCPLEWESTFHILAFPDDMPFLDDFTAIRASDVGWNEGSSAFPYIGGEGFLRGIAPAFQQGNIATDPQVGDRFRISIDTFIRANLFDPLVTSTFNLRINSLDIERIIGNDVSEYRLRSSLFTLLDTVQNTENEEWESIEVILVAGTTNFEFEDIKVNGQSFNIPPDVEIVQQTTCRFLVNLSGDADDQFNFTQVRIDNFLVEKL